MSVWMSVFPSSTKKVLEKNARIYFFIDSFVSAIMPVPLSSFSIVKPRTATVWRGEHRGKTGTLCENNKTTGTMYTSDGLVNVDLKNCWYKKNGKKKNNDRRSVSYTHLTLPTILRV